MIDTLTVDLIGRVLALLPSADLKAARQTARAVDHALRSPTPTARRP